MDHEGTNIRGGPTFKLLYIGNVSTLFYFSLYFWQVLINYISWYRVRKSPKESHFNFQAQICFLSWQYSFTGML